MNENKDHLSNQFYNVLRGGGYDPMEAEEHALESTVECDNCGTDVHMDDALYVSANEMRGTNPDAFSNFYCGEDCMQEHQGGPWRGRIGNKGIVDNVADLFNNEGDNG